MQIPFFLLGLQGIIVSPSPSQEEFGSVDDFDSLIEFIEDFAGLNVETASVYIPTLLLDNVRRRDSALPRSDEAERGDVFRVSQNVFLDLWHATHQSDELGAQAIDRLKRAIVEPLREEDLRYSRDETVVFQNWSKEQSDRNQNFGANISSAGP